MTRLRDSLTVWLIRAARHWVRVLAFAFIVFACVGLCDGHTGHWFAVAKGVAVGLVLAVVMVFPDELNAATRG